MLKSSERFCPHWEKNGYGYSTWGGRIAIFTASKIYTTNRHQILNIPESFPLKSTVRPFSNPSWSTRYALSLFSRLRTSVFLFVWSQTNVLISVSVWSNNLTKVFRSDNLSNCPNSGAGRTHPSTVRPSDVRQAAECFSKRRWSAAWFGNWWLHYHLQFWNSNSKLLDIQREARPHVSLKVNEMNVF